MTPSEHQAMLWDALDDRKVQCRLCGHECVIEEGSCGICRVRRNDDGSLKTLNYGAVVAMNVDPIEKKPLFHFLPGTRSMSIACAGCNFQCGFCQNWRISQSPRDGGGVEGRPVSPEQIVAAAKKQRCASISYTYTEPTVFFELAYETAKGAQAEGIRNCFVSNGFLTPSAVETIAPYLDAINVDLKAFSDETYRKVMKARLEPVLKCLKALAAAGIWLEVTTLVVPGMNDSPQELRDIAHFIATALGCGVPWHVSRFHGDYNMADMPATPVETLKLACRIAAEEGIRYVYCGNVHGEFDERTICPACGAVCIDRVGFSVREISLRDGACPDCGEKIEGCWK
ncbi:MAG: AmmeMemoRadiSam system radical SAM enzyme [Planctomycetota bacterium]|nr:AmmeMemoRadiSam system radical SAM enzyme [Planctomycetota bacterium]